MEKTFLCAMAVYDSPTQQHIETMRARLVEAGFIGRQTPDLPHHITLGIFQPSEREEAEAAIDTALPLALEGFEPFEGRVKGILWYQFRPRERLRQEILPDR